MDGRYRQYARLALQHSLALRAGESVLIQASAQTFRFAEVIAEEVIRAGGLPELWAVSETFGSVRLAEGTEEQINHVSPMWRRVVDFDCRINIEAPSGRRLPRLDPDKLALRRRALGQMDDQLRRQRWVKLLQPTRYLADRLGMSWAECKDFLFGATIGADWTNIQARGHTVKRLFDGGHQVRLVAEGTDLSFDLGGRPGMVGAGKRNLPDGETFYSPVHESVEGTLRITEAQSGGAGWVEDMTVHFRGGRVVDATARRGIDLLHANLSVDEGAVFVGEFGIGINPGIQRIIGNPLFDEKVAGTVHIALGNSFAEIGGTNRSMVHWDLVLDLRRGGEVWLDGERICQDGRWVGIDVRELAAAASC